MKLEGKQILVSALAAIALAGLFVWWGRASCVTSSVSVSVDIKTSAPVSCQLFYTEKAGASFSPERSQTVFVHPGGVHVEFKIPANPLEDLRIDFGNGEVPVRASAIRVSGRDIRTLDWRDFTVQHDIAQFDIDRKGAVDVRAAGKDPYVILGHRLGLNPARRISCFSVIALLFFSLLVWWPLAGPGGVVWNPVPEDGECVCSRAFLVLALILVVARFVLSARLPPFFISSPWDDLWFLNAADSLLNGQWMGSYDHHTLIKGCFGPMVLAASSLLGVPFLVAETMLYVLGCLFFISVCSRFCRNRLYLSVGLIFILFNPLSMALSTFQRIHRNGMPLWQVPVVFACLLLIFLDAQKSWRRLVSRGIAAGAALWMVQNTREDGIWLWPFVLACLAFAAFRAWKGGASRTSRVAKALLCLFPSVVDLCGNAAVRLVNWKVYGLPIPNDRDGGNYAKAMQDLYLIEPDPVDEARLTSPGHEGHYHGIYWSTICRAFDASPTLRKASEEIKVCFDRWAKADGFHGYDLYEDKPLFGIRQGVAAAGFYSSLPESEAYWGVVHEELVAAFKDGRLRKRGFSPTAMCAPFRAKDVPRVFHEWMRAMVSAARFLDTAARPCHSEPWWGTRNWSERLRSISGDRFLASRDVVAEQRYIKRVNRVGVIYTYAMPFILVAALLAFAIATVRLVVRKTPTLDDPAVAAWLFAAGILGSFLLHTACIAYVSATTFKATIGSYMTASYQLELMFIVIVAGLWFRVDGSEKIRCVGQFYERLGKGRQ